MRQFRSGFFIRAALAVVLLVAELAVRPAFARESTFREEDYVARFGSHDLTAFMVPKPPYPAQAQRQGKQAAVMLCLFVGEDGAVDHAQIEAYAGDKGLGDLALVFARKHWKGAKRQLNGTPVKYVVRVPVSFRIPGSEWGLNADIRAAHKPILNY